MEKQDILTIDNRLLSDLRLKALSNVRKRQHFDLRTTPEDKSQRMLNVLEVDTKVPIHQHIDTSESIICLEGKIDCVVYEESSGYFKEIARYRICPREKIYGIHLSFGSKIS